MILEQRFVEMIEKELFKLSFVQWDRFVVAEDQLTIFGWIDREKDAYKDFVVLRFSPTQVWFVATSSLKHSKVIGEILGTGHTTCERAEKFFKIPNVIRLGGGEE